MRSEQNGHATDNFTKEEILRAIATDLPRWGELGLADPLPDGELPPDAQTADVFAHAVVAPGAVDPVEGLLRSVAEDHKAIAHLLMSGARRIFAALLLMRRADGRARTPLALAEDEKRPIEPAAPEGPSGAPEAEAAPPAEEKVAKGVPAILVVVEAGDKPEEPGESSVRPASPEGGEPEPTAAT